MIYMNVVEKSFYMATYALATHTQRYNCPLREIDYSSRRHYYISEEYKVFFVEL